MWRFNCFPLEKSDNKEILERASAVLTRARLIDIESALVSKGWLYLRPLAHFWTQSCGRVKVIPSAMHRIRQWLNKHFTASLWTFGPGGRSYFLFTFTFFRFLFLYSQIQKNEHFSAGLWSRSLGESSYFHFTLTFFSFSVIQNQIQKKRNNLFPAGLPSWTWWLRASGGQGRGLGGKSQNKEIVQKERPHFFFPTKLLSELLLSHIYAQAEMPSKSGLGGNKAIF